MSLRRNKSPHVGNNGRPVLESLRDCVAATQNYQR
ncbi:unnamed protein product [Acanthoscelides obtectus]|uniref:Uncharacterized protein n=1 Tax=Acanthoscelides obtectus TaxID=200917 RepID=A0A9P0M618_ACAOB|nr:unnamed protein product [Acanthoscelides obtectus]CAK1627205.1 hypothetical protein AOBTE_LOCUS4388 [Acanthoscelides obtectus]